MHATQNTFLRSSIGVFFTIFRKKNHPSDPVMRSIMRLDRTKRHKRKTKDTKDRVVVAVFSRFEGKIFIFPYFFWLFICFC